MRGDARWQARTGILCNIKRLHELDHAQLLPRARIVQRHQLCDVFDIAGHCSKQLVDDLFQHSLHRHVCPAALSDGCGLVQCNCRQARRRVRRHQRTPAVRPCRRRHVCSESSNNLKSKRLYRITMPRVEGVRYVFQLLRTTIWTSAQLWRRLHQSNPRHMRCRTRPMRRLSQHMLHV